MSQTAANIPPFENFADTTKQLYLREATTQDALQFSALNPDADEATLTAFLNTVQVSEHYMDAKDWTAQTRQFGLYWYAISTMSNTVRKAVYTCQHCGKKHTHTYDLKDLLNELSPLQGKSTRDFTLNDELIRIYSLDGHAMEDLELKRLELIPEGDKPLTEEELSNNRSVSAKIRLQRILNSIDLPNDLEADPLGRYKNKEKYVSGLPFSQYEKLDAAVRNAQEREMKHGLPTEIDDTGELCLKIGIAKCTEGEGTTPLRAGFLDELPIPMV